jgi:hypothetical protein
MKCSPEGQMFIAENLSIFKEKFTQFLKSFESTDKQLCKEDIQRFFSEMEQEKNRLLAEHTQISRSMGSHK